MSVWILTYTSTLRENSHDVEPKLSCFSKSVCVLVGNHMALFWCTVDTVATSLQDMAGDTVDNKIVSLAPIIES
jgi:hypothetical protein